MWTTPTATCGSPSSRAESACGQSARPSRRGLRHLDPAFREHRVGDVIPDWGGAGARFVVAAIEEPGLLLYTSRRRWLAEIGGGFFDAVTIADLAAGMRKRVVVEHMFD